MFTRTTSTDDDATAETVQSLVEPHLATLLLYGPKIFYYRVFKLVGEKNHKYHRENILELTVSYIYVNLHFLIYIVTYSFMYIRL